MAKSKIHSNQIAVLAFIALHPACRMSQIIERTSISEQNAYRIAKYLEGTGDIVSRVDVAGVRIYSCTQQAVKTIGIIFERATL